jgi:hypothetical protein
MTVAFCLCHLFCVFPPRPLDFRRNRKKLFVLLKESTRCKINEQSRAGQHLIFHLPTHYPFIKKGNNRSAAPREQPEYDDDARDDDP